MLPIYVGITSIFPQTNTKCLYLVDTGAQMSVIPVSYFDRRSGATTDHVYVVVRFPRDMEGMGVTPLFRSLQKLTVLPQADRVVGILNWCAFSLYNSGILSTTVSL